MNKKDNSGAILVIIAGISWGFISIFIRELDSLGYNSIEVVLIRSIVTVLLLLTYLLITDKSKLKVDLKDSWMFLGTGILSTAFFTLCYFKTIVDCGAAVAVVLLYTSPIFVMIMSVFVFKEKITKKKLIALVLTFSGCVLVAGIIGGSSTIAPISYLIGLGAGIGYALYTIFAGIAVKKYSALTITFYSCIFCGIVMFFLCDFQSFSIKIASGGIKPWLYMIGMALTGTLIPYFAYTEGLSRMEASKASVLVTIEPLVGTMLGIFAYHEDANPLKIIGIILIFTAILILSWPEKGE